MDYKNMSNFEKIGLRAIDNARRMWLDKYPEMRNNARADSIFYDALALTCQFLHDVKEEE